MRPEDGGDSGRRRRGGGGGARRRRGAGAGGVRGFGAAWNLCTLRQPLPTYIKEGVRNLLGISPSPSRTLLVDYQKETCLYFSTWERKPEFRRD